MMDASTRNVEKVIRLVLERIAGVKVDRLTSESFAKYFFVEASELIQYQNRLELSESKKKKDDHT